MEITWIGYILLPLGLYAAIFRPRLLILALIFFAPFSATAVINVDSIPFGLQPYHYLGLLLVFRRVCTRVLSLRWGLVRSQRIVLIPLILFWLSAGVTLVGLPREDITRTNIAQLIHLGFGILVAIAIAQEVKTQAHFRRAISVYIAGGLFVSAWGLFQFVISLWNIPYPNLLFNNSHGQWAGGYVSVVGDLGIARISSVATEPSSLAQVLLTVAAILTAFVLGASSNNRLRPALYVQLSVVLVTLVVSTSVTGYVGLVCLAVVVLFRYLKRLTRLLPIAYVSVTLLLLFVLLASHLIPWLNAVATEVLFKKAGSFSFVDRTSTILYAYEAFVRSPWLGNGLGSITSHDLVVKLLSNVGVAGFSLFLVFVALLFIASDRCRASLLRGLGHAMPLPTDEEIGIRHSITIIRALDLAVLMALVTQVFSDFIYTYGHLWILFGLLIGSFHLSHSRFAANTRLKNSSGNFETDQLRLSE